MPSLNETISQIAKNAYSAIKPSDIIFGTVISTEPLQISIEQKITLTKKQLYLSSLVQDFDVYMEVDHTTENKSGGSGSASFAAHNHDYKGTKVFKVKLGLQEGDKVVMIRNLGGQKYFVLDRVR
ncbi:MAG: DUF2577 domain-containing protein [Clostridiales bacterium]|nr:DUF2577 domain-containing protein [Clostridiales bacterium]